MWCLPLFKADQIKKINETIKNNLVNNQDSPSNNAIKTSQVKFLGLMHIQNLIMPFIDYSFTVNNQHYGFDLF